MTLKSTTTQTCRDKVAALTPAGRERYKLAYTASDLMHLPPHGFARAVNRIATGSRLFVHSVAQDSETAPG